MGFFLGTQKLKDFFCIPFIVLYLLSHVKIVVCICMYSILNTKNEFERAVVNEPSVFEPLKVYCMCLMDTFGIITWVHPHYLGTP